LGNKFEQVVDKIFSLFKNDDIDKVAEYIERWYGKDIADWFRDASSYKRVGFVENVVKREKPWKEKITLGMKKKKGLDEFGKNYWRRYLEGTGLDENLLKVAYSEIEALIEKEDELSPVELYAEYKKLGEKYADKGGLDLVRRLRADLLRKICCKNNIASIFVRRTHKVDNFANQRDLRSCYHIIGDDLGIFHFENPSEFNRVKSFLDEFEADYSVPDSWNSGKKEMVK